MLLHGRALLRRRTGTIQGSFDPITRRKASLVCGTQTKQEADADTMKSNAMGYIISFVLYKRLSAQEAEVFPIIGHPKAGVIPNISPLQCLLVQVNFRKDRCFAGPDCICTLPSLPP